MVEKPSPEDYRARFVRDMGFNDVSLAERAFQFNMRAAHQSVVTGSVLGRITALLRSMPDRYAPGRPHLLFYPAILQELDLLTKPFTSVIDKAFRSNVLYNNRFPKPPPEGAIESSALYETIEDLLRTRLVCKYMDGPRFVCEELKRFCDQNAIESKFRELSTAAGYYAWHFYFRAPAELMLDASVVQKDVWVEIQVSTQLAEVITALTHELYETRRSLGPVQRDNDWKWDASSREFRSAYLGHGLHLLEGVIQNLKDDLLRQPKAVGEPAQVHAVAQSDIPRNPAGGKEA